MPSDEASESEKDSENDNVDDVTTSKGVALAILSSYPIQIIVIKAF